MSNIVTFEGYFFKVLIKMTNAVLLTQIVKPSLSAV